MTTSLLEQEIQETCTQPQAVAPVPAAEIIQARPARKAGNYQATVISDVPAFETLDVEWDGFMQEAGARNLCLTHEWLSTWLRYFPPEQLLTVVVRDEDGNWMGAAPLMIRKSPTGLSHRMLRHVQFIGTLPTVYDWMKVIVHPDADETNVLKAVTSVLKKARWDVLELDFMHDKRQLELLCEFLNRKADAAIQETMSIPYLELPESVEAYEQVRRKKTRLEVNRHCNRFEKEFGHPPALEFQPGVEATDAILTRFFSGHIQYWAEKGQKSDFQRFPNLYGFYKDMLAHGETVTDPRQPKLLFSILRVADFQLSYHLGFWQGDGYLCHITNFNQGFRSYSPGTIHMDALVFDSIRRGGTEFEFGRGDEPYKRMWAKDKKSLWKLRLFRNPMAAALWQVDILIKRLMRKPVE